MKKPLTFLLILCALNVIAADRSKEDAAYYRQWIGCKPPPMSLDRSDRTNYLEATYQAKQELLYSFDAGDFVDLPNEQRLTEELQSFHPQRNFIWPVTEQGCFLMRPSLWPWRGLGCF